MEKKQNISNAAVAVIAIIALGAAIYFGLKWFPLTGDQIVGHEPEGLVVQSSLEMESTNINTLTGGKVARVCVKEGDVVAAGDVIAVMDSDTLLAKMQQAEASIKASGAVKSCTGYLSEGVERRHRGTIGPSQGCL